jgi:anti-sigma B factor antagonist
MEFNFSTDKHSDYAVINMTGDLMDRSQAVPMLEEVEHLINADCKSFVISMENTRFLNSTGLNVLISVLTKSRKAGGDTYVCCVPQKINELFNITKLNSVFTISPTVIEAVSLFKAKNN